MIGTKMGKIIIIDLSYANCNLSIKYQTESQNCTKQSYCKKSRTSSPSPQTKQDRIHIGACKWMHLFRNCEEGRSSSASGGYSDKTPSPWLSNFGQVCEGWGGWHLSFYAGISIF